MAEVKETLWVPTMSVLAHKSVVTQLLRQRPKLRHRIAAKPAVVPSIRADDQRGGLSLVVEFVVGVITGAMTAVVEFLLYAVSIISFPFLPFLLPLLAAPVLIAFSLFVIAVGALMGWLF